MWNDIETSTDYLHFSVVSQAVADMIVESGKEPNINRCFRELGFRKIINGNDDRPGVEETG